jgi:hypothetical protein
MVSTNHRSHTHTHPSLIQGRFAHRPSALSFNCTLPSRRQTQSNLNHISFDTDTAVLITPVFKLGQTELKIEIEEKYVGFTFRTDMQNMFAAHYKAKACTGCYCAHHVAKVRFGL